MAVSYLRWLVIRIEIVLDNVNKLSVFDILVCFMSKAPIPSSLLNDISLVNDSILKQHAIESVKVTKDIIISLERKRIQMCTDTFHTNKFTSNWKKSKKCLNHFLLFKNYNANNKTLFQTLSQMNSILWSKNLQHCLITENIIPLLHSYHTSVHINMDY